MAKITGKFDGTEADGVVVIDGRRYATAENVRQFLGKLVVGMQVEASLDQNMVATFVGKPRTNGSFPRQNASQGLPQSPLYPPAAAPVKAEPTEKVDWDGKERRIVRQSCLKAAVELVTTQSTTDVIAVAETFEKWVYRV